MTNGFGVELVLWIERWKRVVGWAAGLWMGTFEDCFFALV